MGSAMEAITVQRVLHGRAEKIPYKNKKASVPNFGTASRQVDNYKIKTAISCEKLVAVFYILFVFFKRG